MVAEVLEVVMGAVEGGMVAATEVVEVVEGAAEKVAMEVTRVAEVVKEVLGVVETAGTVKLGRALLTAPTEDAS